MEGETGLKIARLIYGGRNTSTEGSRNGKT